MKTNLTSRFSSPTVVVLANEETALPFGLAPDRAKSLRALAQKEGFSGKEKQIVVVHPCDEHPASRVIIAGLGKPQGISPDRIRQRIAGAVKFAGDLRQSEIDLLLPGEQDLPFDLTTTTTAAVEAAHLVTYRFTRHKSSSNDDPKPVESLNLVVPKPGALTDKLRQAVEETTQVCQAVAYARDLVNEPPGNKTPTKIAERARELAKKGRITVKVFPKAKITQLGMGGLLSVAAGSNNPPVFLHLHYKPPKSRKTIVLVGKGLTFDSGGLNIKTGTFMNNMKDDMAGAAAVLGIFSLLSHYDLPLTIHGLTPLTENMPGGGATKVGDVFKAYNGKTVEVLNTDAEGRLILADALSYGAQLKPDLMIDVATLTGACVVALGPEVTGVLGTARQPIQELLAMGERTGEYFWELPLFDGYKDWLKSKVADLGNIGKPGAAGTIFAGIFLREFVGDTPWVHLDIAGTSWTDEAKGYLTPGGTGVPIRSLVELLRRLYS